MSKTSGNIFLKNFGSLFVLQIANYLLPMLSMPIISRIIGPEKFGTINYSLAIVNYFVLLVSFGFDLSATRQIAANRQDKQKIEETFSKVFWSRLFLFFVSVVIFSCLLVFNSQFKKDIWVMIFTFFMVLSTVITPNWLFQGMQDLHRTAIFNLIVKIISTVAILIVVKKRQDYIYQPLVIGAAQLIVGIMAFIVAIRKYNIKILRISVSGIVKSLQKDKMMFFSMVVINLYTNTNVVLLGFFASRTEVGYYTAAIRMVSIILTMVTMPLNQTLFPMVGEAFGKSREAGLEKARKILPLVFYFTFLIAIALAIVGKWVITFFYGRDFSPAIVIFQITCFIPCIVAISNVLGVQVMVNLKMDSLFFRVTSIGALISLALNVLIVRFWGSIGSAICLVSSETFITIYMYFILFKKGNIQLFKAEYFKIAYVKEIIYPLVDKVFKTNFSKI